MKNKDLFISISAVLIVFIISVFAVPFFIRQLPLGMAAKECLAEVIDGMLAVAALFILKKGNVLRLRLDGFREGMAAGTLILVMTGLNVLLFFSKKEPVTASALEIVLFVINMIFVGVFEEVLFRGILQEAFHERFGCGSYKNVLKAIICSGVIFGLAHFVNLFAGVGFKGVFIQVVSVIILGMLFGAVYYRAGRNIWVTIFLHALLDLGSFLSSGILSGVSQSGAIDSYSFGKFMFFPIYIVALAWILRKNKIKTGEK